MPLDCKNVKHPSNPAELRLLTAATHRVSGARARQTLLGDTRSLSRAFGSRKKQPLVLPTPEETDTDLSLNHVNWSSRYWLDLQQDRNAAEKAPVLTGGVREAPGQPDGTKRSAQGGAT